VAVKLKDLIKTRWDWAHWVYLRMGGAENLGLHLLGGLATHVDMSDCSTALHNFDPVCVVAISQLIFI